MLFFLYRKYLKWTSQSLSVSKCMKKFRVEFSEYTGILNEFGFRISYKENV